MIVRTNRELKEKYDDLKAGDCFVGSLSLKHIKHNVFVDLMERGVRFFPSALSQILAGSKTAQAMTFRPWMVPHTRVVTRMADLLAVSNLYAKNGIEAVVTKEDRMHCGLGIHRWDHVEAVYNHALHRPEWFPFVLQPFVAEYTDVRVVTAGGYWEAYTRENKDNFRKNLSAGGIRGPYRLTEGQSAFCNTVMERGKFPYAHIDLLITPKGTTYLSEIALNGGLKGAQIDRKDLDTLKKKVLEDAVDDQE